ncbi:MAG TPA: hypothetical protein VG867_08745 [Rhizomicrobium sp.]|nr:hypothetical protein [Rhizomicrobium sp.]
MKTIVKTGIGAAVLGTMLATGVFIGEALAYQEHMHAALDALRTARSELEASTANKGGHREAAIRYVDQAIDETRAGIDFAADHR